MKVILNAFLMGLGLVLTSFMAQAEEYPAANFQPKVLYSDDNYKPPVSSSTSSAAKATVTESSVDDPNFPAANFKPKVLFSDESKISSSKSTKVKKIVKKSAPAQGSSTTATPSFSPKKEEDSSFTLLLGLVVLGVAGYLYTQKSKKQAKPIRRRATYKRTVVASSRAGASGVTKYLKARDKPVRAAKKRTTRRRRPAKK